MAFNITNFLNNVGAKNGLSRSSHFEVVMTLPPKLQAKYDAKNITLTASSANIPNVSLDTSAIRRGGTSYFEYFPTNVTYSNMYIFFYSDAKAQNLSMIKDWIDIPFNVTNLDQNNQFDGNNFRVAYRKEYVAPSMTLNHFDSNGNSIIKYTFYEAFPISIFDIYLNWNSRDDIVNIPVMFKYKYYTQNETKSNIQSDLVATQEAIITKLPVNATATRPIKTIDNFKPGGGSFGGGGASSSW